MIPFIFLVIVYLPAKGKRKVSYYPFFLKGGWVGGGVRGGEGVESEVIVGFRRVQKR